MVIDIGSEDGKTGSSDIAELQISFSYYLLCRPTDSKSCDSLIIKA